MATAVAMGAVLMPLSAPAASATTSAAVVVDGMMLNSNGSSVINDLERTEIAPGLVHVGYELLAPTGWQQINILKAELSDETVQLKYLTPETVSGSGATVSEMTERASAIAGVNLDRFDINNSWAPSGWGISDGEIIKSANPNDAEASVGMTSDGLGTLVDLFLEGSVTFEDDTAVQLTAINVSWTNGGVALYNSRWGAYTRTGNWVGDADAGMEVWIGPDGTVQSVVDSVGSGTIPEGVQVLVTKDDSVEAARLRQLKPGDAAVVSYGVRDNGLDVVEAGGAWHRLVTAGVAIPRADEYAQTLNPRTMIGFSEDRRTAYFVVVDGRQADAAGMVFSQMSQLMIELGAYDAINADGGGSSQMNVRYPGSTTTSVVNSPSDGFERFDGDGMGFVLSQPGSGELSGFRLESVLDDDRALRVFPGLTRTVNGYGHDEANMTVSESASTWTSSDDAVASVARLDDGAVITGVTSGTSTIAAAAGAATGGVEVTVLGALEQLTTDETTINLEAQGSSTTITVTGHDAEGFAAAVEAGNITVTNPNPEVFSVVPTEDGRFTITATGETGSALIGFEAAGVRTEVTVAVPLELRLIDDFTDISGWATAHDRAPVGSVEIGEGHEGSPSIRLNYDFTDSTSTRGRYAVAPGAPGNGETGGIDIPGRPQKLSVWVKGDGKGALLRLQVMQANGVRNWIDGPDGSQSLHVTWTGWQRVDFVVPETFEFPLKLERIRALETVAVKQYTGSLEFSKIYAYLPPEGVESPTLDAAEDASVVAAGETDDEQLRVAVVSDAQFVAREPDSFQIEGARKALREIVAADPDVMILNGDFVDEASVEDFALARQILDEELAGVDFPWYYVPGNHEIMGSAIDNFRAAFGDTYGSFDVDGTRFITLNSASGKLQSEFDQLQLLRERLDAAAEDPSITGVVVVSHMPSNDPLPTKGSQLTDRNEASLFDDWLQDFRADSGKSIASIASHVGVFDVQSVEGVPYVVNGNSGKDPASSPDDGGFTGWTMLGIDPDQGVWADAEERWLEVETKPRVDEDGLEISAPDTLRVADTGEVSAEFAQDQSHDGRVVPVAWPVSAAWGGAGVYLGDPQSAPDDAIIALDEGVITALRPGTAEFAVTVNGQTASRTLTVEPGVLDLPASGLRVTGTARVGEALSVSATWALPDGAEIAVQWLRDGVPIEGADGADYVLVAADHGATITAEATVTAPGYETASQRSSGVVGGDGELTLLTPPLVEGEPAVGAVLTLAGASWQVETAREVQWLRAGEPIDGATASEYTVTEEDAGAALSVRVTATAAGYGTATAVSAGVVIDGEPVIAQPAPAGGAEALTAANTGELTATVDGTRVTITLPEGAAEDGEWLSVFGYSTPVALGWHAVAEQTVSVDAAKLGSGEHRIALYRVDGTLLGWVSIELADGTATDGGSSQSSDGTLAGTGGALPLGFALAALGALLVGGVLVAVRRRRATMSR